MKLFRQKNVNWVWYLSDCLSIIFCKIVSVSKYWASTVATFYFSKIRICSAIQQLSIGRQHFWHRVLLIHRETRVCYSPRNRQKGKWSRKDLGSPSPPLLLPSHPFHPSYTLGRTLLMSHTLAEWDTFSPETLRKLFLIFFSEYDLKMIKESQR